MMTLSDLIKNHIESVGEPPEILARRVGVKPEALKAYIAGEQEPLMKSAIKLAVALKVPLALIRETAQTQKYSRGAALVDGEFTERLTQAHGKSEYSLAQAAKKASVHESVLRDYITGVAYPATARGVELLADTYGVDARWLACGDPLKELKDTKEPADNAEEDEVLLKASEGADIPKPRFTRDTDGERHDLESILLQLAEDAVLNAYKSIRAFIRARELEN